jgi:hypothetical protein
MKRPPALPAIYEGLCGPALRRLSFSHRAVVLDYVANGGNKTQALRAAGYTPSKYLPQEAYKLFKREDIREAVLEETIRRQTEQLPISVRVLEAIRDGHQILRDRNGKETYLDMPISVTEQRKAAEKLMGVGGVREIIEHKATMDVTLTRIEKWVKVVKLYAAQGGDPSVLLSNFVPEERRQIEAAITDADFDPRAGLEDMLG